MSWIVFVVGVVFGVGLSWGGLVVRMGLSLGWVCLGVCLSWSGYACLGVGLSRVGLSGGGFFWDGFFGVPSNSFL